MDTPVDRVLPRFKLDNTGVITLGHILSHTTGLETDYGMWSDVIDTKQDYVSEPLKQYDYFSKIPCTHPPGQRFYYANPLYDMCVAAIESPSGKSIETYLQETFFGPLGMASTSFTGQGGKDAAEGHVGKAIPVPFGPDVGFQGVDHPIA